jgi:hypothetical protein
LLGSADLLLLAFVTVPEVEPLELLPPPPQPANSSAAITVRRANARAGFWIGIVFMLKARCLNS